MTAFSFITADLMSGKSRACQYHGISGSMLSLSSGARRAYLAVGATDLRKRFDGLYGLVLLEMPINPLLKWVANYKQNPTSEIVPWAIRIGSPHESCHLCPCFHRSAKPRFPAHRSAPLLQPRRLAARSGDHRRDLW